MRGWPLPSRWAIYYCPPRARLSFVALQDRVIPRSHGIQSHLDHHTLARCCLAMLLPPVSFVLFLFLYTSSVIHPWKCCSNPLSFFHLLLFWRVPMLFICRGSRTLLFFFYLLFSGRWAFLFPTLGSRINSPPLEIAVPLSALSHRGCFGQA